MRNGEIMNLRKLLKQEIERRTRINELLTYDEVQEFLTLTNIDFQKLETLEQWLILKDLLQEFKITESYGILVYTGSYVTGCRVYYQETEYYEKEVPFDSPHIEYQLFTDIETIKIHKAYTDSYIKYLLEEENKHYAKTNKTPSEFCHSRFGRYLVSELQERYTILNPYSTSKNSNSIEDVQKDFFTKSIEEGQPKAKKLLLSKYPQMK